MYVLITNGTVARYPYTLPEAHKDYPKVLLPAAPTAEDLAIIDVYEVQPVAVPSYDPITQAAVEAPPVGGGSGWVQVWEVVQLLPAEVDRQKQALRDQISSAVQDRLDAFALTRGYDGIVSACSYATSSHTRYGPEGRYCVSVREQTWDTVFTIEADVLSGARPIPQGYADIVAELPVLVWPV